MGRKPNSKEIEEFYSKLDTDKNGSLTKKEFLHAMNEIFSKSRESR